MFQQSKISRVFNGKEEKQTIHGGILLGSLVVQFIRGKCYVLVRLIVFGDGACLEPIFFCKLIWRWIAGPTSV